MVGNFKKLTVLALVACMASPIGFAQSREAQAVAKQLETLQKGLNGFADTTRQRMEDLENALRNMSVCSKKGKLYAPDNEGADELGCLTVYQSGSVSYPQKLRDIGENIPIPEGINEWPNAIACRASGGSAQAQYILPFWGMNGHQYQDGHVWYMYQDGIFVVFKAETGEIAGYSRNHPTCGASKPDIKTICGEGRCIY